MMGLGLGSEDVGPASSYHGINRTFGMFVASFPGKMEGRGYEMKADF